MNAITSTGAAIADLMQMSWAWAIAESLHFIGLCVLFGTVGLVDLRLLGMARSVPLAALHNIVRWGVAAYLINVVTGIAFFVTLPDQYLYNPAFQLKVAAMMLAGANALVFYALVFPQLKRGGGEVSMSAKMVGAVSLCAWTGVLICGRLITFFRPPFHWCFWC